MEKRWEKEHKDANSLEMKASAPRVGPSSLFGSEKIDWATFSCSCKIIDNKNNPKIEVAGYKELFGILYPLDTALSELERRT